jgi:hypothetical protein
MRFGSINGLPQNPLPKESLVITFCNLVIESLYKSDNQEDQ